MKFHLVHYALVAPLLLVGCSSSSASGGVDGGGTSSGGTSSGGTSSGGTSSGGTSSGGTGSGGGSDSGSGSLPDAGSASDAGSSPGDGGFTCLSPATCGTSQVCCGTIALDGGTIPNCTTTSTTSACAAASSCPTTLVFGCTGNQIIRLCASNADCTEASNNKCCIFQQGTGSLNFCSNTTVAGVAGATCM